MMDTSRPTADPVSRDPIEHPFHTLKQLLAECVPFLEHLNREGRDQPTADLLKRIAVTLEHPAYAAGPGVPCRHCEGSGNTSMCCQAPEVDEDGAARCCQAFTVGACATCHGAGRLYTVEQYLKTVPADWNEDSSLERWFPLTAEELERLKAEASALQAVLERRPSAGPVRRFRPMTSGATFLRMQDVDNPHGAGGERMDYVLAADYDALLKAYQHVHRAWISPAEGVPADQQAVLVTAEWNGSREVQEALYDAARNRFYDVAQYHQPVDPGEPPRGECLTVLAWTALPPAYDPADPNPTGPSPLAGVLPEERRIELIRHVRRVYATSARSVAESRRAHLWHHEDEHARVRDYYADLLWLLNSSSGSAVSSAVVRTDSEIEPRGS